MRSPNFWPPAQVHSQLLTALAVLWGVEGAAAIQERSPVVQVRPLLWLMQECAADLHVYWLLPSAWAESRRLFMQPWSLL